MKERKIYAIEESGNGGSPTPSPTLEPNKTAAVKWDDYDYDETEVETEVTPSTGYDGMEKVTVTTTFPHLQSTKSQTIGWDQSTYVTVYPSEGYDAMEKTRVTVTPPTDVTPQVTYTSNGDNYIFPEDFNVDFLSGAVVKVNVPSQPSAQVHPFTVFSNQTDLVFEITFTDSTPKQTISNFSSQFKLYSGIMDNIAKVECYTTATSGSRNVRAQYVEYDALPSTTLTQTYGNNAYVRIPLAPGDDPVEFPATKTDGDHFFRLISVGGSF